MAIGVSKTKFYRAFQHGRAQTEHTFLCIRQPSDEINISAPTITREGDKYHIPFCFVIPDKLPPQSCNHFTRSDQIKISHRDLPATLGDRGCREYTNEPSTDMACISYRIRVKMSNPSHVNTTLTKTKCIRIIPKSSDMPFVERGSNIYSIFMMRDTRSRPFRSRSGQLSVEALQPEPICLTNSKLAMHKNPGTTVTIGLEFEGTNNPPKLRTVASRLRVLTVYSATPWENHPDVIHSESLGNGNRGLYRDDIPLSKVSLKSVEWVKLQGLSYPHKVGPKPRVDESDAVIQPTKYTSSIVVPINIPGTHSLVPTFHSCFISRVYLVELSLSYRQHGVARVPSRISLVVPVQIMN